MRGAHWDWPDFPQCVCQGARAQHRLRQQMVDLAERRESHGLRFGVCTPDGRFMSDMPCALTAPGCHRFTIQSHTGSRCRRWGGFRPLRAALGSATALLLASICSDLHWSRCMGTMQYCDMCSQGRVRPSAKVPDHALIPRDQQTLSKQADLVRNSVRSMWDSVRSMQVRRTAEGASASTVATSRAGWVRTSFHSVQKRDVPRGRRGLAMLHSVSCRIQHATP